MEPGKRLVWVTAVGQCRDHAVTSRVLADALGPNGVPISATCGQRLVVAPLVVDPGQACLACARRFHRPSPRRLTNIRSASAMPTSSCSAGRTVCSIPAPGSLPSVMATERSSWRSSDADPVVPSPRLGVPPRPNEDLVRRGEQSQPLVAVPRGLVTRRTNYEELATR